MSKKIIPFSKWINGLIEEDKDLGVHPVKRTREAEEILYKIFLNSERKK